MFRAHAPASCASRIAAGVVERWRRQTAAGYRLLALWSDGRPVALAGFRVQDNMVQGPHFYVDDLVTDEAARGNGYGGILMDRLKQEARALGHSRLALNAALTNSLGHRFYFRQGLEHFPTTLIHWRRRKACPMPHIAQRFAPSQWTDLAPSDGSMWSESALVMTALRFETTLT